MSFGRPPIDSKKRIEKAGSYESKNTQLYILHKKSASNMEYYLLSNIYPSAGYHQKQLIFIYLYRPLNINLILSCYATYYLSGMV